MRMPKGCKPFKTYFKPKEWARILERASAAGLKPTTYIKQAAIFGDVKIFDLTAVEKLMLAINRYGNNLNQIATIVNTTGSVYKADIDSLREDVKEIEKVIMMYFNEIEYKML